MNKSKLMLLAWQKISQFHLFSQQDFNVFYINKGKKKVENVA